MYILKNGEEQGMLKYRYRRQVWKCSSPLEKGLFHSEDIETDRRSSVCRNELKQEKKVNLRKTYKGAGI